MTTIKKDHALTTFTVGSKVLRRVRHWGVISDVITKELKQYIELESGVIINKSDGRERGRRIYGDVAIDYDEDLLALEQEKNQERKERGNLRAAIEKLRGYSAIDSLSIDDVRTIAAAIQTALAKD